MFEAVFFTPFNKNLHSGLKDDKWVNRENPLYLSWYNLCYEGLFNRYTRASRHDCR